MPGDRNPTSRTDPTLPPGAPRLRLRTVTGTLREAVTDQPVLLIGSRRDCAIPLAGNEVSAVHAAVVNTGREVVLVDLCSRTGVAVNRQNTLLSRLAPGDTVTIGEYRLAVEPLDGGSAASAQPGDQASAPSATLRLRIADHERVVESMPAVIGRRKACHVTLDTPDTSLAHALVFTIDDRPVVFDVGSRSGTYLNGQRITLAWLKGGDRLGIGGETIEVGWDGPTFEQPADRPHASETSAAPAPDASGTLRSLLDARLAAALQALPEDWSAALAELHQTFLLAEQRLGALHARAVSDAAELVQREAALRERQSALTAQSEQLAARAAELEAQAAAIQAQSAEVARTREELGRASLALTERQRVIQEREAELAALAQRLEQQQQALDARQAELEQTSQRIEQFRRAFSEVSHVLAGPFAGHSPGRIAAVAGQGLPAPVIHRPLLADDPGSGKCH